MPDLDNGGTISGKVTFDGTAPKMAVLDVSANPVCAKAHASEHAELVSAALRPAG